MALRCRGVVAVAIGRHSIWKNTRETSQDAVESHSYRAFFAQRERPPFMPRTREYCSGGGFVCKGGAIVGWVSAVRRVSLRRLRQRKIVAARPLSSPIIIVSVGKPNRPREVAGAGPELGPTPSGRRREGIRGRVQGWTYGRRPRGRGVKDRTLYPDDIDVFRPRARHAACLPLTCGTVAIGRRTAQGLVRRAQNKPDDGRSISNANNLVNAPQCPPAAGCCRGASCRKRRAGSPGSSPTIRAPPPAPGAPRTSA